MASLCRATILILAVVLGSQPAHSRPEKIKPGDSYYSDEVTSVGQVEDIVGEKNYEEVYQLYTYYEVIYDDSDRVKIVKEYKRGELLRTESYQYNAAGGLKTKTTQRPGEPTETLSIPE